MSYSLRYMGNIKGFNYHCIFISNNNKNLFWKVFQLNNILTDNAGVK